MVTLGIQPHQSNCITQDRDAQRCMYAKGNCKHATREQRQLAACQNMRLQVLLLLASRQRAGVALCTTVG
jgi:hypothetical protein